MSNIIGEKNLVINDKTYVIRLSMKSLYKTQIDLKYTGLIDLLADVDRLNLNVIYTLISYSVIGNKLTIDELIDSNIELMDLVTYLGDNLGKLFEKRDNKLLEKK